MDCGEVGAAGYGGHGHNDVLSFVLSSQGSPIFVDPGTYTYYGARRWRDFFRSTVSHNSVQVDFEEIAPLGRGLFEIAPVAVPNIHRWAATDDVVVFDASHDGYRRLARPVTHRRQLLLVASQGLVVRDRLDGEGTHHLVWRLHCAPDVATERLATGDLRLIAPGGAGIDVLFLRDVRPSWEIDEGWFSPCYGQKVNAPLLRLSQTADLPVLLEFAMVPFGCGEAPSTARFQEVRSRLSRCVAEHILRSSPSLADT